MILSPKNLARTELWARPSSQPTSAPGSGERIDFTTPLEAPLTTPPRSPLNERQTQVLARAAQSGSPQSRTLAKVGVKKELPSGLPPYLRDLYRTELLTPEEERRLFTELRALEAAQSAGKTTRDEKSDVARSPELTALRNHITEANLRLVVSIAKQFVPAGTPEFFDLVSEGNGVLMRAVDLYNPTYGYRFSTYATTAIRRHFARVCSRENRQRQRFVTGSYSTLESGEGNTDEPQLQADIALDYHARLLLNTLNQRERFIVEGRFGFGEKPLTFRELGEQLGISKERVRQLLIRALSKLRTAAERNHIEPPGECVR